MLAARLEHGVVRGGGLRACHHRFGFAAEDVTHVTAARRGADGRRLAVGTPLGCCRDPRTDRLVRLASDIRQSRKRSIGDSPSSRQRVAGWASRTKVGTWDGRDPRGARDLNRERMQLALRVAALATVGTLSRLSQQAVSTCVMAQVRHNQRDLSAQFDKPAAGWGQMRGRTHGSINR